MAIAPLKRLHSSAASFRQRILYGVLIGASTLAGCRTSRSTYPVAATSPKPSPTESQYAWGAVAKPSEMSTTSIPSTVASKNSGTIALTSTVTTSPTPGPFGLSRSDATILKPVGIQSTEPTAPRSVNSAPLSSTALTPTPLTPTQLTPTQLTPTPLSSAPPAPNPNLSTIVGGPVIDPQAAPTIFGGNCNDCCGGPRNFGVSADQCGLCDNISARFGGTVSAINDYSTLGGAVGILEGTKQLGRSNLFVDAGVATEVLDDHWPISFTAGVSRLARIRGDQVCEPGIFSVAYDGYWDSSLFGSGDEVYADQMRILAGFALRPRWDVGAWGAIGGNRDHGEITVPVAGSLANYQTARYFTNRVAGYSSFDLNDRGAQLITSAGWEDSPGGFFVEADGFFPVGKNVNFFTGMGYSANGSWDGVAGIELLHGSATKQRRPAPGAWGCGDCGCEVAVDCGDRYRGGWANGVYRSALRVLTPSRARRYLANEYAFVPPPIVIPEPDPVIPQAPLPPPNVPPTTPNVPTPTTPTPTPTTPTPTPTTPTQPPPVVTEELCPPRLPGHDQVDGRLSEWLKSNSFVR